MKEISYNEQETRALGQEFAANLHGGEILAISGNLGAGKTQFCQGLAKGLGVKENVNSPTFNILRVYEIRRGIIKRFVHVDAYRLQSEADLAAIGIYDYFSPDTIIAIEWPENISSFSSQLFDWRIGLESKGENMREVKMCKKDPT